MDEKDVLNLPFRKFTSYNKKTTESEKIEVFLNRSIKEEKQKYSDQFEKNDKWFLILRVGLQKIIIREIVNNEEIEKKEEKKEKKKRKFRK
jgi:hypothetical protein